MRLLNCNESRLCKKLSCESLYGMYRVITQHRFAFNMIKTKINASKSVNQSDQNEEQTSYFFFLWLNIGRIEI